ncbi:MAG: DUF4132 domain-containing protein [Armatimonadota bacterium]
MPYLSLDAQQNSPVDAPNSQVRALLADSLALLGPLTPLPALFEEVVRVWRGLPVQTERYRGAVALLERLRALPGWEAALISLMGDAEESQLPLLVATVWALARPEIPFCMPEQLPDDHADPAWTIAGLACFTAPDPTERYPAMLNHLLEREFQESGGQFPTMLPLLGFLKGLHEGTLSQTAFDACVQHLQVLHPEIASHRPLRSLHRLLDYLGLSAEIHVQSAYRQLVSVVWPQARAENWPMWQWVTIPGGPELFVEALRALDGGEHTITRLYEVRYAPLPTWRDLALLLSGVDFPTQLLAYWLRPEIRSKGPMGEVIDWLLSANRPATQVAYTNPPWWDEWCYRGLPAACEALIWLQEMDIPPAPFGEEDGWRHAWFERCLLPEYRRISANLLLAKAASGEGSEEILTLACLNDLSAVRALGMLPEPDEATLDLLRQIIRTGGLPEQEAARAALERLARRRGLSGRDELERQRMLAAAWDQGPLAGERVRVGWEEGLYRLRLSLQAGKVQLDVLGPRGPLPRVPAELRNSDAYQQARSAQKETQQQYRLFRHQLEEYMLAGTPFSLGEFRYLQANPVFAHLAERLLWRTAEGRVFIWTGPERWETLAGEGITLSAEGARATWTVSLVHPIALAGENALVPWQLYAADHRLMQPFKQLFREVYTLAGEEGTRCQRFAGRRLDPQRAYAVLRAAGYAPGNGIARREWPRGITAHLCWAEGATGRDLFGPHRKPDVTSGAIWFSREGEELPLARIDPIIFSETLRAADLLTTRATIGEAELTSRETIALRASLLRQVARAFGQTNIAVPENGQYAMVLGTHAIYRVNLASGTVLLEPEGRQLVVPRPEVVWRPVEDGDATTEIMATVLELAHDELITDLTFLAQVASGGG